ncbi:MAG: bifunctional [glutamine synthetase] adenylyltransferase/[glutamine synthetase]-adenylyl-L-tyrosine phosphorylase [Actinomycetaceae bacterium]|nr:bifunctional [glutamine synthetase] adenylyltransferase/[glutamine synthetase]-adenylyl-L-tyrosine phosphorylase [Actinomycetaceae bacterium]
MNIEESLHSFSTQYSAMLRRCGISNVKRAEGLCMELAQHSIHISYYAEDIKRAADPDACLLMLVRLCESCEEKGCFSSLLDVIADDGARSRLFCVLGMSSALGNFLCSHPSCVKDFLSTPSTGAKCESGTSDTCHTIACSHESGHFLNLLRADEQEDNPVARLDDEFTYQDAVIALRYMYYRRLISLVSYDLSSSCPRETVIDVMKAMSELVAGALEGALALARSVIEGASDIDFSIIAMGKTGGEELNYISDVDVIYVCGDEHPQYSQDEAVAIATRLAIEIQKIVSGTASEKELWPLDANLRPEGKDGPLVRTLQSHRKYYQKWAHGWEYQALLKARHIAGTASLGKKYEEEMRSFVWQAAERENFVQDVRAMRRRVEEHIDSKEENRHIKLGRGGLRDIEFTVQLLQLVHGREDENLRVRGTIPALRRLSEYGYVSRGDASELEDDYLFLRLLEHRIQLRKLKRSHVMPADEDEQRIIARSLHDENIRDARALFEGFQALRVRVRRLHLDIFYRPMLPLAARVSRDEFTLTSQASQDRLRAIGYHDPVRAFENMRVVTEGVSRAAVISRHLLPVMLMWFAQGPYPDYGLFSFRLLFEKAGTNSWFMRTLRDGGAAAERLCRVLSSSRYLAEELLCVPECIQWLVDTDMLKPLEFDQLQHELSSMVKRRVGAEDIAMAGRFLRRRELVRAGLGQVLGSVKERNTQRVITRAGDIVLEAALQGVLSEMDAQCRFAVIAMGRFGGEEMCYSSDGDVVFVYETAEDGDEVQAEKDALHIASRILKVATRIGEHPPFECDASLRPEGDKGTLVRSFDSYMNYIEKWSSPWERQALVRARFCVGDEKLGRKFIDAIAPYRYPENGLTKDAEKEIRLLKLRMEQERIPRSIDNHRHVKLGRGGLSDVEWTVQMLQMRYAYRHPDLQVTRTLNALEVLVREKLIDEDDAALLRSSWLMASRLRDMNVLSSGKAAKRKADVLAHESSDLAGVAFLMGRDMSARHDVEEEYLRVSRRARRVVERVFYGIDGKSD